MYSVSSPRLPISLIALKCNGLYSHLINPHVLLILRDICKISTFSVKFPNVWVDKKYFTTVGSNFVLGGGGLISQGRLLGLSRLRW